MSNIAIIGSGSFGCALANSLSTKHKIKIWAFKKEEAEIINKEKKCMFIKDYKLNENIKCYTEYKDVIKDSEYIILVTPSNSIKKIVCDIKKYITNQKIIVASKGFDISTNKLLSTIVKEELKDNEIGVLSGPSLAVEVVKNYPTIISFASDSINEDIKELFSFSNIHIETNNDIVGTELGGALKNIFALASGILEGLALGENIKSVLITKGLKEIILLGKKLGAQEKTFYGPSCLGDLILTCNSNNSRNYNAGILLSKNKSQTEIEKEIGMVVEGFDALKVCKKLIDKYDINLKIINTLYEIVYKNKDVKEIVNSIIS